MLCECDFSIAIINSFQMSCLNSNGTRMKITHRMEAIYQYSALDSILKGTICTVRTYLTSFKLRLSKHQSKIGKIQKQTHQSNA